MDKKDIIPTLTQLIETYLASGQCRSIESAKLALDLKEAVVQLVALSNNKTE